MISSRFHRIAQWRRRADDYRTLAERCSTTGARDAYESLAANCACLAETMEEQLPLEPGDVELFSS
jgi:hypothetical protein